MDVCEMTVMRSLFASVHHVSNSSTVQMHHRSQCVDGWISQLAGITALLCSALLSSTAATEQSREEQTDSRQHAVGGEATAHIPVS